MGHACSILVFPVTMSKDEIQNRCYRWQSSNADLYECGPDGPREEVYWTSRTFPDRKSAEEYLDGTFGNYDQTAVRFKEDGKEFWAIACEVHC